MRGESVFLAIHRQMDRDTHQNSGRMNPTTSAANKISTGLLL